MPDGGVLLLVSLVEGDLSQFCQVERLRSAHQLLHFFWPEHYEGVGGADRVKAQVEGAETVAYRGVEQPAQVQADEFVPINTL